jgi:hypothetical protein
MRAASSLERQMERLVLLIVAPHGSGITISPSRSK